MNAKAGTSAQLIPLCRETGEFFERATAARRARVTVAVYPEATGAKAHLKGAPPGVLGVRWMLAHLPEPGTNRTRWANGYGAETIDPMMMQNEWILNYGLQGTPGMTGGVQGVPHSNLLTVQDDPFPGDGLDLAQYPVLPRNGTVFTYRKGPAFLGNAMQMLHAAGDAEITRETNRTETLRLFRTHTYFVCYDPGSFLVIMAAMLGCIPVVHPVPGLSKFAWLNKTSFSGYLHAKHLTNLQGVAYGWDDVEHARRTIGAARAEQFRVKDWGLESVARFARDARRWAAGHRGGFEGAKNASEYYPTGWVERWRAAGGRERIAKHEVNHSRQDAGAVSCNGSQASLARSATDDPSYADPRGHGCADWAGRRCSYNHGGGYSPADMWSVRWYCPMTCKSLHPTARLNCLSDPGTHRCTWDMDTGACTVSSEPTVASGAAPADVAAVMEMTQASIDARNEVGLSGMHRPGPQPSLPVPERGVRVFYNVYAESAAPAPNTTPAPRTTGGDGADGRRVDAGHLARHRRFLARNTTRAGARPPPSTACGLAVDDASVNCYLDRYSDLRANFGTNLTAGRCHWVEHGYREGRQLGCARGLRVPPRTSDPLLIVREQLALLRPHHTVDFTTIGGRTDVAAVCREQEPRLGRPLECIHGGHHDHANESVTLERLHAFCVANPQDTVAYIHNKGSFHPSASNTILRRFMTRGALSDECSMMPAGVCNVCATHVSSMPHLHATGNMFVVRCDYAAQLLPPIELEAKLGKFGKVVEKSLGFSVGSYLLPSGEHWVYSHPSVQPCDLYDGAFTWGAEDTDRYQVLGDDWTLGIETAPRYPLTHYCSIFTNTSHARDLCTSPVGQWLQRDARQLRWRYTYGTTATTVRDSADKTHPVV